jgi:outer membrane lipoprotein carrier protein
VSRLSTRFAFQFLLACSLASQLASGEHSPEIKQLIDRFESRYRAAHTLQATFLERYLENGHLARTEAGTAYFRRPGKMRWEYESPEKNLFLVDGKSAWFFVPADHTVTRVPARQSSDWRTPLSLLAGEMKVSHVCAKVEAAPTEKPESPENAVLFCELRGTESAQNKESSPGSLPQATAGGEVVFFEIVKNSGELVRVLVRQSGGVEVEFRFANWKTDPPLAEALFRFSVPPGVAIVNGELPHDNALMNQ